MLIKRLVILLTLITTQPLSRSAVAENSDKLIRLGLMTELSGPAASVGIDCRNGFEAARRELSPADRLGSYRLTYLYEDTKGLPAVGVSAYRKLSTVDRVDAVILKRTAIGMPVNPLSKAEKLPIVGLVGAAAFTSDNPFAFRFYPTTSALGTATADLASAHGMQRVAVVSAADEWQLSVRDSFLRSFSDHKGQVVFEEQLQSEETDFAEVVLRIRQSAPDGIFVNLAPGQTGLFVKKLREQQLKQQLLGNFYIGEPGEIAKAGAQALEGALLTDIALDRMRVFKAMVDAAFPDLVVNSTVYTCYSGLALVLEALKRSNTVADRASLHKALLKVDAVPMPDGALSVKDREIQYDLGTFVIRNGRAEPDHKTLHR